MVCSGIQASKSKASENLYPIQSHRSQCTTCFVAYRCWSTKFRITTLRQPHLYWSGRGGNLGEVSYLRILIKLLLIFIEAFVKLFSKLFNMICRNNQLYHILYAEHRLYLNVKNFLCICFIFIEYFLRTWRRNGCWLNNFHGNAMNIIAIKCVRAEQYMRPRWMAFSVVQ